MNRLWLSSALGLLGALGVSAEIATAGTVLVDLDASRLALNAGDRVGVWANAGTAGDFTPVNGTGPVFALRGNVPVVRFAGNVNDVLGAGTLGGVPAEVTGNANWTCEAWICDDSVDGTQTYFSFAPRNGLNPNDGACAEMRYSAATDNAVEHWGGDFNMAWGTELPAPGQWHHVVCVHEASGSESLYVDGRLVNTKGRNLRIQADGQLLLSAVWERRGESTAEWVLVNGYSGDIAQLRFQTGVLNPLQVYGNYLEGNSRFGRDTATRDAVWQNGSWVNGGQTPSDANGLVVLAPGEYTISGGTYDFPYLRIPDGSLKITGGAKVNVRNVGGTLSFGTSSATAASLVVEEGDLTLTEQPSFGTAGGTMNVTVGGLGADRPATISSADKLLVFGVDQQSHCVLTVKDGGTVSSPTQWIPLGQVWGECQTVVEKGGLLEAGGVFVGRLSGTGRLDVYGLVVNRGVMYVGENEASSSEVNICDGGELQASADVKTYFDAVASSVFTIRSGGTFHAIGSGTLHGDIVFQLDGRATVEVDGSRTYTIARAVQDVTEEGVATLVKTGMGRLNLTQDVSALTGDIYVDEGLLAFSQLPPESCRIHVGEKGAVGLEAEGGATAILSRITTDSTGAVAIFEVNKNESLDLSNHPSLGIAGVGTFEESGLITTAGSTLILESVTGTFTYTGAISDRNGQTASVTIRGFEPLATVRLTVDNSGMTGNITVESGMLALAHPWAAGGTGKVVLQESSGLYLQAALGANFVQTRVADGSRPARIFIGVGGEGCNVDLSRFPGCVLGTSENIVEMTGTVTANGDEILLGGGNVGYWMTGNHGLKPGVLADKAGVPVKVVVGQPGMIDLSRLENSYSGGTVVTNRGIVFAKGDGFGAVPAEFDPQNIYVDNGVIRQGDANTVLAPTRGVWVGEGGLELHPWGTYTFEVTGGLGGNGPVSLTDGGFVTLAGDYNTYAGHIKLLQGNNRLTIGGGDTFSWVSTGGIETIGNTTVVLNSNKDVAFGDKVTGAGGLEKQGTGAVSLTQVQPYTGATTIADGALVIPDGSDISATASIYNDGEIVVDRSGALTDILGKGAIAGAGQVRFTGGHDVTVDRFVGAATGLEAQPGNRLTITAPGLAGNELINVANGTLGVGPTGARFVQGNVLDRFVRNGDATLVEQANGDKWIRLTAATGNQRGSAWWPERVEVMRPWRARFVYRTVNPNGPADGFTFFLQTSAAGTSALGGTGGSLAANDIQPSMGAGFNIYGNDSVGWIINGARQDFTDQINGIKIEEGNVLVELMYDGYGTFTQRLTQNNVTFTKSYGINLYANLKSSTAWIGFTGATGGSVVEQYVSDFSFVQGGLETIDLTPNADTWQCNGITALGEKYGYPAIHVTPKQDSTAGSATCRERLYIDRPFTLTCTYNIDEWTGADGAAIFFHNDRADALGAAGGSRGFLGGDDPKFSTCVGWAFNIYNEQRVEFIKNASVQATHSLKDTGIDLYGHDTAVTISYDRKTLKLRLVQDDKVFERSADVNLSAYFGTSWVYLGVSGGTGGLNASQWIYGLAFEGEDVSANGYAGVQASGVSVVAVENPVASSDTAEFGNLIVKPDAALTLRANGGANTPYVVQVDRLTVQGASTVALEPNGSAEGTLKLGVIVPTPGAGLVALKGKVVPADEKIRVYLPKFAGMVAVADLTDAVGVAEEDFELETESRGPAYLVIRNGILYAMLNAGTVIHLR